VVEPYRFGTRSLNRQLRPLCHSVGIHKFCSVKLIA
jgi:hypothetical protein